MFRPNVCCEVEPEKRKAKEKECIDWLHKEQIITALSNLDEQKLTLALMYAENYLKYGIDITEKIDTAVKNTEMINMAERYGYCKCLANMRKRDGDGE